MNREERFKLYERLYFNELERRERISARLSLPFAAILANVGLLSFMLNSDRHPESTIWQYLFWLLFSAAVIALVLGAWFFRKAWFGHTDRQLPTADDIKAYHVKLTETYGEFDEKEELVNKHFDDFLFKYLITTSSANTINNDNRSYSIFRANYCLTIAVLLALSSAVPFYIGDTTREEAQMTEPKAPPPPPPPPPERMIKDGNPKPPPSKR